MRIFLGAILLTLLGAASSPADPLRVVATSPFLGHWTEAVGGMQVRVSTLPERSAHPSGDRVTADDVKALAGARVLVRFSPAVEPWTEIARVRARNSELIVLDVLPEPREGDERGGAEPWLDPVAAAAMCRDIARGLERADPFDHGHYERRLAEYDARLRQTLTELRAQVAGLADRRLLLATARWRAYADALGFEVQAVLSEIQGNDGRLPPGPEGASREPRVLVLAGEEPTAEEEALARESGLYAAALQRTLGPGQTYLELLQANTRALLEALSGSSP